MSNTPARSCAFAMTVLQCHSRNVASFMHCFSILIDFARRNVHEPIAYPAEMKRNLGKHSGLLQRTVHQFAQETDARWRGRGLCTRCSDYNGKRRAEKRQSAPFAALQTKSKRSLALGVCWTYELPFVTPFQPSQGNNRATEYEPSVCEAERAQRRRADGFRCALKPLVADQAGINEDAGLPSRIQGLVG